MISGTLGLDERGQPTTPYTTTLDTRFNDELERMREHEKQVRTLTGSGSPVVAAKIAWHRLADADSFARTRVFVTAGGFIGGHLAGLSAEAVLHRPDGPVGRGPQRHRCEYLEHGAHVLA